MGKKRDKGEDRGRCMYCGRVTTVPAKVVYELGTDGAHSRYSHHRRRVLLDGVEIKPLCAFRRAA